MFRFPDATLSSRVRITSVILSMTKLLGADWLRGVQLINCTVVQ